MTRQYYIHDGMGQQGPFTLEELIGKKISQATPVWYDGLGHWTSAAQLEELKPLFAAVSPPFIPKRVLPTPAAGAEGQSSLEQDRKKGMNVLLILVVLAVLVAIGVYFASQAAADTTYGGRYIHPGQ